MHIAAGGFDTRSLRLVKLALTIGS
jgi:hypothetical protein